MVRLLVSAGVVAAVPPLSPEELKASASNIVIGEVRNVYVTERTLRKEFTDRLYVLEVLPKEVVKGKALSSGRLIYARTWRPSSRPPGWAGPQGQNEIPERGKRVRLYLARDKEGGWDVLTPNGVEQLPEK